MKRIKPISRRTVVNGVPVHFAEAGNSGGQTLFFLHGYPENWREFEAVGRILGDEYRILAMDLPGIGGSGFIENFDKLSLAHFIKDTIQTLNLEKPVVVGHDIGGMITYSIVRNFPELLGGAVIICTAIPGVEPWDEVKRNPHIWHFALFAVPELPEKLISGRHDILFEYFYRTLAFNKAALITKNKNSYISAYDSDEALETSFGWYRAFPSDEKDNSCRKEVKTPVLYLKGEKDFGDIATYLQGFEKNGLLNVHGASVPGSGHFAPEENPQFVAEAINRFVFSKCDRYSRKNAC